MAKEIGRIDITEVTNRKTYLETKVWGNAYQHWDLVDRIVNQQTNVVRMRGASSYHSASPAAKIQTMVDTLITAEPVVKREPENDSETAKDSADRVERAMQKLLVLSARESIMPPQRIVGGNFARYGYAWQNLKINMDVFPPKPEKGRGLKKRTEKREKERLSVLPFRIEAGHPKWVLMPGYTKEPEFAIEIQPRPAFEVERQYDNYDAKGKTLEDVEVWLSWDKKWRGVFVDGQEILVVPNGWGFVPYVQGMAGFGYPSGVAMNYLMEDLAVGLLSRSIDALKVKDEMLTALHHLILRAAYPHLFTTEDVAYLTEALQGTIVQVSDVANLKWEEFPQVGNIFVQLLQAIEQDIAEGTFVGEVSGERTPGVNTALQHALILNAARLRFGEGVRQLNYMSASLLGMAAKVIETMGETVKIGGIIIGPDDIRGNYEFEVDYLQGDAESNLRKNDIGLRMWQAGAISQEDYLQEWAGVTDASGAIEKRRREELRKSEWAQGKVLQLASRLLAEKYPGIDQAVGEPGGNGTGEVEPLIEEGLPANPNQTIVQPGSAEEQEQVLRQMQEGG